MSGVEVTAVVVTYRSARYVGDCLESLAAALAPVSGDVVVVDNASDDGVSEVVSRFAATHDLPVRFVPSSTNGGFAAGCHAGADVATGRRLLFVNPDVVVDPGAVRSLLTVADAHPRAGLVGGRSVDSAGVTDPRSWWGRPTLWSSFCFATGLSSVFADHPVFDPESPGAWRGEPREVPAVSGALMLVERALWDGLGGFDPTFLLYGEDVDLSLRARRAGWAPRVDPGAVFRHDVGRSSGGAVRAQLVLRGRATLLRRHLPRGQRRLAVTLLVLGTGLRALAGAVAPSSSRPRTSTEAWRSAWRRRRSWSRGWTPGDSLAVVSRPDAGRPGVLVVVQNLPFELDRRVRSECAALTSSGYTVSVICPKRSPDEPDRHIVDDVVVRSYPAPGETHGVGSYLAEFVVCWLRTARLSVRVAREEGFDVLQACNPPDTYWLLGLAWKALAGKAFVFDQHDLCPEVYEARFGRRGVLHRGLLALERATYRVADQVVSPNPAYAEVAMTRGRVAPRQIGVVMSTPDARRMVRREIEPALRHGRRHLACYVGVMGPQDGVDRLVEAIHTYVNVLGRGDCHFALIGFGDSLGALRTRVAVLGLGPWVTFTGRVGHDEISRWLSTASVGFTPDPPSEFNHRSTMNKTLEYMAHGVPVIATDLRETRRCAGDAARYTGDGEPAELAGALAELLDDPGRRRHMGRVGRIRIERELAWETQAASYLSAIDRALSVRGCQRVGSQQPQRIPPKQRRATTMPVTLGANSGRVGNGDETGVPGSTSTRGQS